jgi:hypothetical protein
MQLCEQQDWKDVGGPDGKVLYRYKECVDAFPYNYTDENGKASKVLLREKRVLTYSPSLGEKQRHEIRKMADKANGLCLSRAKKSEFGDCGKYISFRSRDSDEHAVASLNAEAVGRDLKLAGYNLLVTSETNKSAREIYAVYHNLWRIEESFRIMKSDLDARPVFLQKENTIKGHFLICYLAVLLERILQFKILKNKYPSESIYHFFKTFEIAKGEGKSINLTARNDFIVALSDETNLPLTNYFLTETQLKQIMNWMP